MSGSERITPGDKLWSWGVVEVRPNNETIAEKSLGRLGYHVLCVRYTKLLKGARIAADGRRIRSRKDELQLRPFIPGYLFLGLPDGDDATLADGANGVRRVFRHRDVYGYLGKPKLIRARIVEQIQQAALDRDETPKAIRDDLKPGDRIRIPGGIEAILIGLDSKGRAEYFADLLGREVRGRIDDASQLELVGS